MGSSNAEKWVTIKERNSFEVLIPFNKEHQVLLKLPVSLVCVGGGVRVWRKNGAISKSGNFL